MDIDLSQRDITELCFETNDTSTEEMSVAEQVLVLRANDNRITCITGLGRTFCNVVQLHLSHNNIGELSTPAYVAHEASTKEWSLSSGENLCAGIAPWIEALPPTLEMLDVSYNHIQSFVACTCQRPAVRGGAAASTSPPPPPPPAGAVDGVSVMERRMRHACPLALSLFFSQSRFPHLKEVDLSHNAFACSLRESEAMEKIWSDVATCYPVRWATSVSSVNVSANVGLAALNCLFLASEVTNVQTICAERCGIEDLTGLSGVATYSPNISNVTLKGNVLSTSLLGADAVALGHLFEAVLLSLLTNKSLSELQEAKVAREHQVLLDAVHDMSSAEHLTRLNGQLPSPDVAKMACEAVHQKLPSLAVCLYACLLREVLPSLALVDELVEVSTCQDALVNAAQKVLLTEMKSFSSSTAPVAPTSAPASAALTSSAATAVTAAAPPPPPPQRLHRQNSLSELASAADASVRPQVFVNSDKNTAKETAADERGDTFLREYRSAMAAVEPQMQPTPVEAVEDWGNADDQYAPASLPVANTSTYNSLCVEAARLEEAIAESRERRRMLEENTAALNVQLSEDRRLVADQRRQLLRVREEHEALWRQTEEQRHKLRKRKKEVSYGVNAMSFVTLSAAQKEAMQKIEKKEQELKRKEKALRQQMALSGLGPTSQSSQVPPRRNRSDVLRAAAAKRKMEEQNAAEPLGYTPSRFRDATDVAAETSAEVVDREEAEYLKAYAQESASVAQKAATQYGTHMSSQQQEQLHLAAHHRPTPPPPSLSHSQLPTEEAGSVAVSTIAPTAAAEKQELSALTVEELFEAAAAIRRRQMALQQLQHSWETEASRGSRGYRTAPDAEVSADSEAKVAVLGSTPPPPSSSSFLPPSGTAGSDAQQIFSAIMTQHQQQSGGGDERRHPSPVPEVAEDGLSDGESEHKEQMPVAVQQRQQKDRGANPAKAPINRQLF